MIHTGSKGKLDNYLLTYCPKEELGCPVEVIQPSLKLFVLNLFIFRGLHKNNTVYHGAFLQDGC